MFLILTTEEVFKLQVQFKDILIFCIIAFVIVTR